ncbi:protein translocase subunit SecF [Arthrobacter sp. H14]|uniref:protein translocase subunit SecF n=1 Tax=Arthrobacter sp. H14 TaxID=1312959 RepID=UPI00047DD055|nr:protein translocase subunit SecF [Arthrobacter sp. H14]
MPSFSTFGNELYTGKRSYDFVGKRKLWFSITLVLIVVSIIIPVVKGGFNLGIDFRGGSQFTVSNVVEEDIAAGEEAVTSVVAEAEPRVTNISNNTMRVQTDQLSDEQTLDVRDALREAYGVSQQEVTSTYIGPAWGQDVTRQAIQGLIIFVALAAVMMAIYFRTWKMSLAAVSGMVTVLVTSAGLYSLSDFEITPSAVIGFLTILGYSLYDTVVVFDKIRENTLDIDKSTKRTFAEQVNLATNQTLVRSINTSVVAVLPVASILFIGVYLLGAGTLRDLALALFVGIIIGAATTIFVAAPMYSMLREGEPELQRQAKRVRQRRAQEEAEASRETATA